MEELGEVVRVVGPAAVVSQLLVLGGEPAAVAPLGVLRHCPLVSLRISSRRDDAGGEEARLASGLPAENHTLEGPQALVEGGGEGVAAAVEAGREAIVSDAGSRDGVEGRKAAAGAGAWLVIIRWQPSAAPATRTNGCALAAPGLAGRLSAAIGCHRIITSQPWLWRMAAISVPQP